MASEVDQCKLEMPCEILALQSARKPSVTEKGNIARCVIVFGKKTFVVAMIYFINDQPSPTETLISMKNVIDYVASLLKFNFHSI